MTVVVGEEVPHARRRLSGRLRAVVLGPHGGGTTRRRATDAFRLVSAIILVAVSVPVMRANSAVELAIVRAVHERLLNTSCGDVGPVGPWCEYTEYTGAR